MLLFRADASAAGQEGFDRLLYLAQLLRKRCPVLFRTPAEKAAQKILQERKIASLPLSEEIAWDDISAVIVDLPVFSPVDRQLLAEARKRDKKTVQFAEAEAGRVSPGADLLLDFAAEPALMPLHQRFRHFQRLDRRYRRRLRRIFLALGDGVDYRPLKEVVDRLRRARLEIRVAPFSGFKKAHAKALRRLTRQAAGIRFVGKPECLARALFESDAALILAGQRAYEAAACGTPALYFASTPGQRAVAELFVGRGAGIAAGDFSALAEDQWLDALAALTYEKRLEMGGKGKALIDGLGVHRVLDRLQVNGILG